MRPWGRVLRVEGMTALHATASLHGHYRPTYVSQPGASVYTECYYYQYYKKEWLVESSGVQGIMVEGEALRA